MTTGDMMSDRDTFQILALPGSLRRGSYNQGLLRAARELTAGWAVVDFYDPGQLPFFNEDVEAQGDPAPVREFKQHIHRADALLIAAPEYNGFLPGVLVNALDWASRPPRRSPLKDKPAALMGAVLGRSGAANAQIALRAILTHAGALVLPGPGLGVGRAAGLFDAEGHLHDGETRQQVGTLVEALARWAGWAGRDEAAA